MAHSVSSVWKRLRKGLHVKVKCPYQCELKEKCEWRIDDPKFDHCFWAWVSTHSDDQGVMIPLSQSKIMTLLNLPTYRSTDRIEAAIAQFRAISKEEEKDE